MNDSLISEHLNYWVFIVLMMLGLWAMISKKNLIKKIIGMGIFQSSIILFYISIATKETTATIPIYPHDLIHPPQAEHGGEPEGTVPAVDTHAADPHAAVAADEHGHAAEEVGHAAAAHGHRKIADLIDPDHFDNPLPHVLMLTAIVVGVATLGVALSLVQRLYRLYGSIEEDEVLAAMARDTSDGLTMDETSTAQAEGTGSHA